jgi:hypothetical protein
MVPVWARAEFRTCFTTGSLATHAQLHAAWHELDLPKPMYGRTGRPRQLSALCSIKCCRWSIWNMYSLGKLQQNAYGMPSACLNKQGKNTWLCRHGQGMEKHCSLALKRNTSGVASREGTAFYHLASRSGSGKFGRTWRAVEEAN